jgi:hypothetical protein
MPKPTRYRFSRREIARHKCLGCGVNVIKIGHYCMLNSDLWERELHLKSNDNMCIDCIERRIGRKLRGLDFISYPRVEGYPMSDTLLERLGFTGGKNARAIELRDLALRVVKARGKIDKRKALYFDDDRLAIGYSAGEDLPHGLTVWRRWTLIPVSGGRQDKTTQVLKIVWHDADVLSVRYEPGRWEERLENLAAENPEVSAGF